MKATDDPIHVFSRWQPALRRHLYLQHAREVASSSLGAGLGLVIGAALIVSAAGRADPLASAVRCGRR